MPGTFKDELVNGIRNAFCTILEIQNNYYGYVARGPFVTARYAQLVTAVAYRLLCNREPPPEPDPPFTGGQCPTRYTVNYNVTYDTRAIPPPNIVTDPKSATLVWGKIKGIRVQQGTTDQVFIIGGSSSDPDATVDYPGFSVVQASGQGILSAAITSVVRTDGLPDTCGDPPIPTPTPTPGYNETDINIIYTDNSDDDVSLSVPFIFAPITVNLKGELTVPIRIDVGDVDFQLGGDINLSTGGIDINFGNRNYNRNGQPNPDSYECPTDTPGIPPTVPEPVLPPSPNDSEDSTTRVLRGVIVTVTSIEPGVSTLIFQGSNPDLYVPDLGFVQFQVAIGTRSAWLRDVPVRNQRHFIPCEWEAGAISVRGTPRPGVEWTLSEVYASIEDEVDFTVS